MKPGSIIIVCAFAIIAFATTCGACDDYRPERFIMNGDCLYDDSGTFYGCMLTPKLILDLPKKTVAIEMLSFGGPPLCVDGYKVEFRILVPDSRTGSYRTKTFYLQGDQFYLLRRFTEVAVTPFVQDSLGNRYFGPTSNTIYYRYCNP